MPASPLSAPADAGYSLICYGGGRQNCADLHSYGPGIRSNHILHYILSGRGFLEANGRVFPAGEGETFLIYPHTVIQYYPDPADPWEYIWADFGGSGADTLLRHTGFTPENPVSPVLARSVMEPLYNRIQESAGPLSWNRMRAAGALQILLSYYMELFPRTQQEDEGYGYVISALQYIKTRFHRPLSVQEIADHLGVSRTHLYRLFRRCLSASPGECLTRLRIEQAGAMLRDSSLPIGHIARSVGFDDPLYFTKVFRRATGRTPTAYRQEMREEA